MLPAQNDEAPTRLQKMEPTAKAPSAAVLGELTAVDRRCLKRRLSEIAECVFDPMFEDPRSAAILLEPMPQQPTRSQSKVSGGNDDSGADLLRRPRNGALNTEQEHHMFRRLNYCRYRVMQVIKEFADKRLTAEATRELLRWEHATRETREDLMRVNMPLVLAMAKRARVSNVDFADLVSEGNLALLRSVDKFDCARGFKFSTYACRAILKSFSRVAMRTARYRGHFPTEFDPNLEKSDFLEHKRGTVEDDCVDELKTIIDSNLAKLSEVEERVIRARFALDDEETMSESDPRAKTLEQVGMMIGVTKERVRQIQNKALGKLRCVLEDGILAG
ncbi:MAG: sigma-70 family RNA polymerase sigma factor [Planctomycetota bacterium]